MNKIYSAEQVEQAHRRDCCRQVEAMAATISFKEAVFGAQ